MWSHEVHQWIFGKPKVKARKSFKRERTKGDEKVILMAWAGEITHGDEDGIGLHGRCWHREACRNVNV